MGRTAIAAASIITPIGPYPTLPVTALSMDLAYQAADVANGNQFTLGTGKYIILVRNVHATIAYTITFTSIADPQRRTGDITTYSLAALKGAAFLLDQQVGWAQTDGQFYLSGSDVSIQFCIIRLT